MEYQKNTASNVESLDHNSIWRDIGRNLLIMMLLIAIAGEVVKFILGLIVPLEEINSIHIILVNVITIGGFGYIPFYFMMKRLPDPKVSEVKKLKTKNLFMFIVMCFAIGYLGNMVTLMITSIIGMFKESSVVNPLINLLGHDGKIPIFLYMVFFAPVAEEFIFRKVLLDKIRRYGDQVAIVVSGVVFGLFHQNLSQFFYAAALGMMFAYLVIRTNNIWYSVLVHFLINLMGSISLILPDEALDIGAQLEMGPTSIIISLVGLWTLISLVWGTVLIIKGHKKAVINKGEVTLDNPIKTILNPWMIGFVGVCLISIVTVLML